MLTSSSANLLSSMVQPRLIFGEPKGSRAFRTIKYDAILEETGWGDKHLLIGFDRSANLIEILYNDLDEDTVRVFHAMECRNSFKALLNY